MEIQLILRSLISALLLLATPVYSNIGEIAESKGDSTIKRDKTAYTGEVGLGLEMNDNVVTGKGKLRLDFVDDTRVDVTENSRMTIDEFIYDPQSKVGKIVSNIKIGTVRIITGEISKKNPDNLEVNVPTGSVGARGTEFVVVTESDEKSTVVLLGPGKKNTLGMIPGILNVSDGFNTVNISTPGFQSVVFK